MNTAFCWGIAGSGHIARKVARAITKTEPQTVSHRIGAVYSRNHATGTAFAQQYQATYYHDFAEMLAQADVDGIYIATPHVTHYPFILQALEAGKPVLCEKPVTMNAAQLAAAVETAQKNGVYFSSVMSLKYGGVFPVVRQILTEKPYGKCCHMQLEFGYDTSTLRKRPRLTDRQSGGGALLEIGVYSVALLCALFDRVEITQVKMEKNEQGIDLEDTLDFLCDGVPCRVKNSLTQVLSAQGDIIFEHAHLILPFFYRLCRYQLAQNGNIAKEETMPFSYRFQFDATAQEILNGATESARNPHAAMLREMALMDTIRELGALRYPDETERTENYADGNH